MSVSIRALSVAMVSILAVLAFGRPARSSPGFAAIAEVLQSPRCMNCHPAGDAPLQTDASRPHKQNIKRVFPELGGGCDSCHQDVMLPGPHLPPGAPGWKMPPVEMAFQGKSVAQLCQDLQDPDRNGHRTPEELIHHVETDPLVLWAFSPGPGRTPPPVTHAEFVALIAEWVDAGAPCPN